MFLAEQALSRISAVISLTCVPALDRGALAGRAGWFACVRLPLLMSLGEHAHLEPVERVPGSRRQLGCAPALPSCPGSCCFSCCRSASMRVSMQSRAARVAVGSWGDVALPYPAGGHGPSLPSHGRLPATLKAANDQPGRVRTLPITASGGHFGFGYGRARRMQH